MAKDKSDRERKKEKKEKEKKRSETDGVHKKSKKDKKKDTSLLAEAVENELTTKVLEHLEKPDAEPAPTVTTAETTSKKPAPERIVGSLVPFANPLAQDKVAKKVLKSVKKGMSSSLLVDSIFQPLDPSTMWVEYNETQL